MDTDKPSDLYSKISQKITTKDALVGVLGVGYVGKELVLGSLSAGFVTIGYDLNPQKTASINHPKFLKAISVTDLENCDVICICVPTPLDEEKKPDLSFLTNAIEEITRLKKIEKLIIVESTVAPGTLSKIVLPQINDKGLKLGEDFFLAISPERIDPGNKNYNIQNTPKVVGGIDEPSKKLVFDFYSKFVNKVVPTSSSETAEFAKIFENTFRLVNISLVNQLKEYAESIGVDMWEVIDAAATKPYGFLPHYPGPGVGGHCIPVDPVYLLEEARNSNVNLTMVEEAVRINESLPLKIVDQAKKKLNGHMARGDARMLLVGITYKPNVDDIRESPALKIWEEATKEGFEVSYHDPYVPQLNGYDSITLTQDSLLNHDVIVIVTNHKNIPYELFTTLDKPIIDTRNIFSKSYFETIELNRGN